MDEKVKDILAGIQNGADATFSELTGVEAAFIAQETEEIMKLHREILGNYKREIDDIIGEFGDNPVQCLGILNEHLNGGRDIIF